MKLFQIIKKTIEILEPRDGYNRWAATYASEANPVKNLSDDFIRRHLPSLDGKTFLDVGCGTGKFCLAAAEGGAREITGVDLSSEMISRGKQSSQGVRWIEGDLLDVDLGENTYDVIVCALVLAHIADFTAATHKLFRHLSRDGILVVTDFHPYQTLMNAKRTFRHEGKTFEIRHHLHLFDGYFKICREHGAEVKNFEELKYRDTPVVFGMQISRA